jgi:hypothetical protein
MYISFRQGITSILEASWRNQADGLEVVTGRQTTGQRRVWTSEYENRSHSIVSSTALSSPDFNPVSVRIIRSSGLPHPIISADRAMLKIQTFLRSRSSYALPRIKRVAIVSRPGNERQRRQKKACALGGVRARKRREERSEDARMEHAADGWISRIPLLAPVG